MTAPTMILVAGFGDNRSVFEPMLQTKLAQTYSLAAIDLPGFGALPLLCRTTLQRLAEVVDAKARELAATTATGRDAVLRARGERGITAEAARKLKCRWCKERGMTAAITPHWAGSEFGSQSELAKLVATILRLKPRGEVT